MLNAKLLKFDGAGRIRNTSAAPSHFSGGVGFSAGNLLCVGSGAVTNYHQSNPFVLNAVMGFDSGTFPTYFSQGGLGHVANSRLAALVGGAVDHYNHGLPCDALGNLVFATPESI